MKSGKSKSSRENLSSKKKGLSRLKTKSITSQKENKLNKQARQLKLELQNKNRALEIEAALERVRSRAMAMQKSEELQEAANVLFKQMRSLGIPVWSCGYNIWNKDDKVCTGWMSSEGMVQPPFKIPLTESPTFIRFRESKERKEKFYVEEVKGKALAKHYKYMMSLPDFAVIAKRNIKAGYPLPFYQVNHVANFKQGNLVFIASKPVPEAYDIFKRFAKVFEQTYTRFLDLQKAEAQAREAQIEAAVERVRAKALAMYKSDEIIHVANALRNEMEGLKIPGIVSTTIFLQHENNKIRMWEVNSVGESKSEFYFSIDKIINPEEAEPIDWVRRVWDPQEKFFVVRQNEKDLRRSVAWTKKNYGSEFTKNAQRFLRENKIKQIWHPVAKLSHGKLSLDLLQEPNAEIESILTKIGTAFDLAYKRFLDLQKAEAQAREAQIEAAVERVRAKALAMHKSEDLHEAVVTLKRELMGLQLPGVVAATIYLQQDDGSIRVLDLSSAAEEDDDNLEMKVDKVFRIEDTDPKLWIRRIWYGTENFFVVEADEEDFVRIFKWLYTIDPVSAEIGEKIVKEKGIKRVWLPTVKLEKGKMNIDLLDPPTPEIGPILLKMGAGFDLAYKRFLDLQKAEAQTKEAQIEAALEKVRSRSLAMHKSDELREVVAVLLTQLKAIGFDSFMSMIGLIDRQTKEYDVLMSSDVQAVLPQTYHVPYFENEFRHEFVRTFEENIPYKVFDFGGQVKRDFDKLFFTISDFRNLPEETKQMMVGIERCKLCCAFMSYGCIEAIGMEELNPQQASTLQRFATVFEQCYTRFLDLQKAEAQAREAQIEAALEKVRSRSLAMHHSNELEQVAGSLFDRLAELNLSFDGALIFTFEKEKRNIRLWIATNQLSAPAMIDLPYDEEIVNNIIVKDLWLAIEGDEHVINRSYSGEEKNNYFRYVAKYNGSKIPESVQQIEIETEYWTLHCAAGKNSMVGFDSWSGHPTKEEDFQILRRFAKVFDQAYVRFLDLQKAEAQAKEAQIQLALERVRARTMAMHKSSELSEVVKVLFEEFKELHTETATDILARGFINIINEPSACFDLWITEVDGSEIQQLFKITFDEPTTGMYLYESWKKKEPWFIKDLRGEELNRWLDYLTGTGFKVAPGLRGTRRVNNFIFFSRGYLGITSTQPLTDDSLQLLIRFAKVFEQTYTRFLDLQNAEAQAREAVKRASVDRVRAEIASMRTTADLQRITPLVWNELKILGVSFTRCGVFIMDEAQRQIHTFLSTPDGKAISSFHLPYDAPGAFTEIVHSWEEKKIYVRHWGEAEFLSVANELVKQGSIANSAQYMATVPSGINLHCLPFLQGMLYVGNSELLSDDELQLAKNLADAFSTAYARYEDFNKLEVANTKIEKTLTDLKQTQTQLVQSEKMASLGELTAGIAHEIQNPLNFVNNFSEVSKELLDEMKAEIEKGNLDDGIAIVKDIVQNLEKINFHGKRADGIVKSMLQHSRKSSGQKEQTDINALCDEYLRLAFHGLRAKDKSFNAKFETDFDSTLPKVNVTLQDIGRVILNLINNAFYAVSEKSKLQPPSSNFQPQVVVSTKNLKSKIEISVRDNGTGIPESIKEKIFQPFFTTKPTGQGTGLGLSLAFEIVVKGHGGELALYSDEGRGSEFKVLLPLH